MSFQFSRVRSGEWVAAIGAAALMAFMFFFQWFAVKAPAFFGAYIHAANLSTSHNAWQGLHGIRWLLLLSAFASACLVALAGSAPRPKGLVLAGAIVAALGALSALLVLNRALLNHPFVHVEVKSGAWLGLAACVAIAYGGLRAALQESEMRTDLCEPARIPFEGVAATPGAFVREGEASETPANPRL